jgi:hypothetical protein
MWHACRIAVVAFLAAGARGAAQEAPAASPTPGTRVRVDADAGPLVGGAIAGLAWTVVMDQAMGEGFSMDYAQSAMIFGATGLAAGAMFGGQERWQRVPLPPR